MSNTHLNVENLTKIFKVGMSKVIAVDNVSFGIDKNDSVSIVGESGSGKTTLANLILGVETLTSGSIKFEDNELDFKNKELRKKIQFVQQNPLSSLNFFGLKIPYELILGGLGIILLLEATRRAIGIPLVAIALIFLLFGFP